MASSAKPKARHWGILLSFLICVIAPTALAGYYLYAVAVDQYESRVGFAVRAEETESALDVLSGISGLSHASSSDTDILYKFIQSQEIVERINAKLDLRAIFTKPAYDPVFELGDDPSIESLLRYWQRMVRIYYDSGTGLIEVRVFAFEPEDAHAVAELIFEESSDKINALTAIAREDATRYAEEERDQAIARLIDARRALTAFRVETQIVDPSADIAGQMGLLNTLQGQLAEALIELDLILETTRQGDPRVEPARLRIRVIEDRIAAERTKLGVGGQQATDSGDPEGGYAAVIGEFEELQVDLEFAETSYISALSAYDAARSEAQRTSRYLTAYVRPTQAQTSTGPDRLLLTGLVLGFALLSWFIGLLVYYSLRDRR
jgi:capsular polysaccharide transport system permease protein